MQEITERQVRRVGLRLSPATARRRRMLRRRGITVGVLALVAVASIVVLQRDNAAPPAPVEIPGSPQWALEHYGDPDAPGFKARNIVSFDFLGRTMFVHRDVKRHFLRLERLFEARAPEYAATVALGELDDWSYENRNVRGAVSAKSNHAFGLAIDINALTNVLLTPGDMPMEVVHQWEIEGGDWGGDWERADPMHFESHLTPEQIRKRYKRDGAPRAWYLQELIGG